MQIAATCTLPLKNKNKIKATELIITKTFPSNNVKP